MELLFLIISQIFKEPINIYIFNFEIDLFASTVGRVCLPAPACDISTDLSMGHSHVSKELSLGDGEGRLSPVYSFL